MATKRKLMILRTMVMILLSLFVSFEAGAQKMTYKNDKSKTYQLRSMENGKWEFHPGLYYVTLHKSYSGGYWKFLNIRWDVKKSNVGQVFEVRAAEVLLESEANRQVQCQIDTVENLAKEETLRSAERMIDGIYLLYDDKFKQLFSGIDELTSLINEYSKGKLLSDALDIIEEKKLLQSEVDYIHETGPTRQMEQAKRQLAYEDVLKKLNKLYTKSYNLAYYARTINNLKK